MEKISYIFVRLRRIRRTRQSGSYGENHMNIKKIIGVSVGLVATGFGVHKLLSGNEPLKYSSKWFEAVSDEVLNTEREIVRKRYCSAGDDFSLAVSLQNLLSRFDSVLSKRA